MGARGPSNSCNTCRQRRVKCDGIRPVCGRCLKGDRQCLGFNDGKRLILKDETQTVIKRFRKKSRGDSSPPPFCEDVSTSELNSPASSYVEYNITPNSEDLAKNTQVTQYQNYNDATEWLSVSKVHMSPVYEQNQVALFCCRETVNLRTLSWIMSDDKWIDLLPEMMGRSEALTSVIHANASTYLAKLSGAPSTPRQALTHYAYALKELQKDLYDPIRQTSDETLFAIILLGVFDLHNNASLGSWQAHVQGATKLIQCNGPEHYKQFNSPSRVLAKYVRGFDIIRAMSNAEETVFGNEEWDDLAGGLFVRPLDSLLYYYGKVTNLIAKSEKIKSPSVEHMSNLLSQLKSLKAQIEEWKTNLPSYYESILLPVSPEMFEHPEALELYPYTERYDYLTGFIGHTMNMYRAAILRIDRYLLGHMFPTAAPSELEISLAKEIVMSMPSLFTSGGIFLLYPAMRATKVLSREEKLYIVSMLNKISAEVPVATLLAQHVLQFEFNIPMGDECTAPSELWDIKVYGGD